MSNKIENRLIAISEAVDSVCVDQCKKEHVREEIIYWSKFTLSLAFMLVSTFLISSLRGIS